MWKKLKEHLKEHGTKYILAILGMLFGADQAQEAGLFGSGSEEPYKVMVSFALPDGGGAFPAFSDDAGPVELTVIKPTDAIVRNRFIEVLGELYPTARVTGFIVVSRPGQGKEPEEREETGAGAPDDI